jgi:hypothetical protein
LSDRDKKYQNQKQVLDTVATGILFQNFKTLRLLITDILQTLEQENIYYFNQTMKINHNLWSR